MTISLETRGDIFESKASVLLCPANTVGAMGKGLAQVFRHRHPDLYYRYKQQCRKRRFHPETLMLFSPGKTHRLLSWLRRPLSASPGWVNKAASPVWPCPLWGAVKVGWTLIRCGSGSTSTWTLTQWR